MDIAMLTKWEKRIIEEKLDDIIKIICKSAYDQLKEELDKLEEEGAITNSKVKDIIFKYRFRWVK